MSDGAHLPGPVDAGAVTADALRRFVAEEARLLDEQRWIDWNALFAPGGWYWLPASPKNSDPLREASHLYDDDVLRRVRIARLVHPAAHSQRPPGRGHHLLQGSHVLRLDAKANRFELRTPFIYTELRAGRTTMLPGVAWHHLALHDGALGIVLKRVDLLHADEALPAIEFYI